MLKIYKNYCLKKITTYKIGGNAFYYCKPGNYNELLDAFNFSKQNQLNYFVVGGGANLLISDQGYKGLIIHTINLNKYYVHNNFITFQCGISINKANKIAIKNCLSGLEFSYGLPGTIGGAVVMNARCYGKEFSEIVEYVTVIDNKLNQIKLEKDKLNYNYKRSFFLDNPDFFVYEITLKLNKSDKKSIRKTALLNYKDRKKKGQFLYPSCGCVFKNDYNLGISTGKLIDSLGLKGYKIGGAEIYEKHANFIINKKNASAKDVKNLIEFIEKKVYEEKSIKLEREVQLLGF